MIETIERNNCANVRRGPGKKSKLLHLNIMMDKMNELDYTDIFEGEPM